MQALTLANYNLDSWLSNLCEYTNKMEFGSSINDLREESLTRIGPQRDYYNECITSFSFIYQLQCVSGKRNTAWLDSKVNQPRND